MVSEAAYLKACASCLLHDLQVACKCLGYHAQNEFNPFSKKFHDRLDSLHDEVFRFYLEVDSEFAQPIDSDC